MAKITTRTLTPTIGAVVEGIDLSRRLDDEEIGAIRAALLKHKVIFFEDQHITPVQHRDFAARFGELHTPSALSRRARGARDVHPRQPRQQPDRQRRLAQPT
ncbi:MAG: TauD/TfdA family dioxygenase [Rhizomicrobium sp.]